MASPRVVPHKPPPAIKKRPSTPIKRDTTPTTDENERAPLADGEVAPKQPKKRTPKKTPMPKVAPPPPSSPKPRRLDTNPPATNIAQEEAPTDKFSKLKPDKPAPQPNKTPATEQAPTTPQHKEPSRKEKKKAAILIQACFRRWHQRKQYNELYEKRKWTLHKPANTLTNHVTKGRPAGRAGRRPPTRGKRVVGLEKPTYENRIVIVSEEEDTPQNSPAGPTRATNRPAQRPMTSLGQGLVFDPSKVQLKSSPKPTRANDAKNSASCPNSPIAEMRRNLRPTTMFGAAPVQNASKLSKGEVSQTSPQLNIPMNPIPPRKGSLPTLPKPSPKKQEEKVAPKGSEDSKTEPFANMMLSPRSGRPMAAPDPKQKRRTKKTLTSFLPKRPTKSELVATGIIDLGAEAYPELGKEFHSQQELPQRKPPAHLIGKNCMVNKCGKKVKGKKNINCYRCGKIICKNCTYAKKLPLPEFGFEEAVIICIVCHPERQKELLQHKAEYLKKIAASIK